MSEKRFTLDDEENGLCRCILVDGEEVPTCEICELLNTLHQENQQLKHYKLYEDNKRLQTIIADLKEENEQLKEKCDALQKKTEMDKNDFFISEAKRMTLLAFIKDKALQKEYLEWERRIYDE